MKVKIRIYHCFWFGEKRKIRKYGIKIKKIWGEELAYDLIVPVEMVQVRRGPLGGEQYYIYKHGRYLGDVYLKSLHWNPGSPFYQ